MFKKKAVNQLDFDVGDFEPDDNKMEAVKPPKEKEDRDNEYAYYMSVFESEVQMDKNSYMFVNNRKHKRHDLSYKP